MEEHFNFEELMFDYVEQIKECLSPKIWKNVLLDCSKNEILTIWLLYRRKEVNMTMIADYINAPLNTATGVVSRLEKKSYVVRRRSEEDKRVVTIQLDTKGEELIGELVANLGRYIENVMKSFTPEELMVVYQVLDKTKQVLLQERERDMRESKVRKINIEF